MTPQLAAMIVGGLIAIALPLFIYLLATIVDQRIDEAMYGPIKDDKNTHPSTY